MQITYSEICKSIYATSALTTLNPESRLALLHPDHSDMLKTIVRDSMATIITTIPADLITSVRYDSESVSITTSDKAHDTERTKSAFVSATTLVTLIQIKIAASDSPDAILRLAGELPAITRNLVDAISPKHRPARIRAPI